MYYKIITDLLDKMRVYKETANAMIKAANEDKKRNKTEPER